MAKQRCLAQFNKASKVFICFLSFVEIETLDSTYFEYVEVYADPDTQTVQGKYPSFAVVNISDLPTRIYERELNDSCREKITKQYDAITQIDRMRPVLEAIVTALNLEGEQVEAFREMNAFIDDVKAANKVLKQSYIDHEDFEFVTIEQETAEFEARMDGGLHELVYGPRKVNTSS